ncbi:CHAT domain-containing protein [uncultured Nostoc sp.]|uniref:nSTAND1 domain-containing NTPase n=1 Tax=uncultured Nostoc sp. TaxID=340711 RepID=UPI0035CA35DA
MKKLVILKFDGNFESGFQVNLEIANERQRAYLTTTTNLLENISIPQILNNWHKIYCSLDSQFRIKSEGSSRGNLGCLKQECTRESINLVASFNQWLNAPSFTFITNTLKELNSPDEIRIIITTSCHELRQLPWHLWEILTELPLVEVALSSPNAERRERPYREKIRILIILGDRTGINIHQDKQYLQSFCGNDAEIILIDNPSREELNHYLQDNLGWDILFFSGHSQTQGMQGRIYLNDSNSLTMAELRDALQVAIKRRLQIAFFNSCDGLGIAYELEQLNIPQVIVMREPVPDEVAQKFLKYFLQQFTSGKSLYISVKNARLELKKLESEFPCASWLPVIVQNQTETPPTWQSLGIISFCPYQGLEKFTEEKAKYFFGRDRATSGLVAAVNNRPLVAVIGASGSGKSSLVFAGLIPQLRRDTVNNWLIIAFRPGKNPFESLAVALVSALNLPEDERRLVELELDVNLKGDRSTLQNFITDLTDGDRLGEQVTRVLLIADQFEEIYTLCTESESRKTFLDSLLQAVKNAPFFTLVLTLRADFLSRALDDYEPFGRALQEYQLEPVVRMSRQELESAITRPATQLGFEFEQGLSNTIINDIQDGDGRLPLLEFTLTQLWKQQHSGRLTHQAYKNIGGVEKALANYADVVYAELSESEREKAQRVFIQLVQPGEGTEDTRKLATSEEVGGDNWDLVTHLADKRLVVTNRNESTNEETVEVVHEALIRHWGRLRGWMQENRKFRIWQQGLMVALQQWVDSNRDDGALLRGATLAVAEDWLQQRRGEVSKAQRRFIEKGVALRERERKQRERLRRSIIGGLAGGLILVLFLTGFGWWQWQEAQIRAINAQFNNNSLSMEALLASNSDIEALIEALKTGKKLRQSLDVHSDTKIRTVAAVRQVVYGVRELNRFQNPKQFVTQAIFTSSNKTIASFNVPSQKLYDYQAIQLWSEEGRELLYIKGKTVILSPDGKTILSADEDGTIKLWNLDGKQLQIFKIKRNNDYLVPNIRFSPDSKMIAFVDNEAIVKILRLDGNEIQTFKVKMNSNYSTPDIEFSPDSKMIVSVNDEGFVKIRSIDGKDLQTLKLNSGVSEIQFSSDGKFIAFLIGQDLIELRNVKGTQKHILKSYSKYQTVHRTCISFTPLDCYHPTSISFSHDGHFLASGAEDGTINLFNLDSGKLKTISNNNSRAVVSFSPDSKIIVSGDARGIITLWDRNGKLLQTFKGHHSSINSISFSPDNKSIISASKDGIKIWSTYSKEKQIFQVSKSTTDNILDGIYEQVISFSPDGKIIASTSRNGRIIIWSIDGKKLLSIPDILTGFGESYSFHNVIFNQNGKTFAVLRERIEYNAIEVWSLQGKKINTFKIGNDVTSICFNPDGTKINIFRNNQRAKSKNTKIDKNCTEIKKDEKNDEIFAENTELQEKIFSPDGSTIVSGDDDGTIKLWSKDGRQLQAIKGHSGAIRGISFSPDSKTLASAGDDGKIILWNFDLDDLLKKGCDWLHDYLQNNSDVSAEDRHLCDDIKR